MKSFLNFTFICVLFSFRPTQDEFIAKVVDSLSKGSDQYPVEKIYLHLDRPFYLSGEKIWFKSYVVAGSAHTPTTLSKVFYVELVSPKNTILKRLTLPSELGSAFGNFSLPDSLKSGVYRINAYTKWMSNFACDYYFSQEVKIWSLFEDGIKKGVELDRGSLDVQFFPEGGILIAGVTSRLAFKAVNESGLGEKVKGRIVNSKDELMGFFESNLFGMGTFTFAPQANESYFAVLSSDVENRYKLPASQAKGFGLYVVNNSDKADIVVRVQTNSPSSSNQVFLVAHVKGILSFAAKVFLPGPFVTVKMPKQNFQQGVSQITLFDASGNAIAERLVYIEGKAESIIQINADKPTYKPREKVSLSIEINNQLGETQQANLSLSVIDTQQILLDENASSILTYLNLTSELRGNIESPGYYFNSKNSDRFEALDALLLTQGWRRFIWEDVLLDRWPVKKWTPEQGISLGGELVDRFNGKPILDGKVLLMEGGFGGDMVRTATGIDGKFQFIDLKIYDTTKIYLQGQNKRGNKEVVKIRLDTLIRVQDCLRPKVIIEESLNDFELKFIENGLRNREINASYNFDVKDIMLEGIEVKGTKLERAVNKIYGSGSKTIRTSDRPGSISFLSPLQLLQGIPGVQLFGSGSNLSVQIRGTGSVNAGNSPLILLDNTTVNAETMNRIPIESIESVEIYKGADATIFGTQGANGAIAFYSKTGILETKSSGGFLTISNLGYQVPKEFYTPKYDVVKSEHVKPDERSVLLWKPNIETNLEGKVFIQFYNHDLETTVVGQVEGISKSGYPIKGNFSYQVKK